MSKRKSCLNATKYSIEIGKLYGTYRVVEVIETLNSCSNLERKWKCENIYTKKVKIFRGSYLNIIQKREKSSNKQLGLRNYLYKTNERNAIGRKRTFNLSFEEFNSLIAKNCYYCNEPPKIASDKTIITRGDRNQLPIYYNGIDRLNPEIGYSVENCVACCSICNYMKHVQQEHAFLSQIEKIYNFRIKKN